MVSSVPMASDTVEEAMTSTIVERMQIVAKPEAFCFMR